jgi:hypothetical protein
MRENLPPSGDEKQASIDLAGCDAVAIPDTRFHLVSPEGELQARIALQFEVRRRLAELRNRTIRGIKFGQEVFGQSHADIGRTPDGDLVFLICSVLATSARWQGGWFIVTVPPNDVENFAGYLHASQAYTVANLRLQQQLRGSKN